MTTVWHREPGYNELGEGLTPEAVERRHREMSHVANGCAEDWRFCDAPVCDRAAHNLRVVATTMHRCPDCGEPHYFKALVEGEKETP